MAKYWFSRGNNLSSREMERLSDAEDFVPPTPRNPKKKLALLGKKSSPLKNMSTNSKTLKNTGRMSKRKKISGVSPEFKKFKDKSHQLTLFNYLKKDTKSSNNDQQLRTAKVKLFHECEPTRVATIDCNSAVKISSNEVPTSSFTNIVATSVCCNSIATSSNGCCNVGATSGCSSAVSTSNCNDAAKSEMDFCGTTKTLSQDFPDYTKNQVDLAQCTSSICDALQDGIESVDVVLSTKTNSMRSITKNDELSLRDPMEIENLTVPSTGNCNPLVSIESTTSNFDFNNGSKTILETDILKNDNKIITDSPSDEFLTTNQICNDVSSLSINFDDRSQFSDFSLSESVMESTCDGSKVPYEVASSKDFNKSAVDMEQSFSWMEDLDWKTCETEKENCFEVVK